MRQWWKTLKTEFCWMLKIGWVPVNFEQEVGGTWTTYRHNKTGEIREAFEH